MPQSLAVILPRDAVTIPSLKRTRGVNPAVVYLESLGSEVSRRTMISPLNRAARIIDGRLTGIDAWKLVPWEMMKVFHVRDVMASLTGSPATRNKALQPDSESASAYELLAEIFGTIKAKNAAKNFVKILVENSCIRVGQRGIDFLPEIRQLRRKGVLKAVGGSNQLAARYRKALDDLRVQDGLPPLCLDLRR